MKKLKPFLKALLAIYSIYFLLVAFLTIFFQEKFIFLSEPLPADYKYHTELSSEELTFRKQENGNPVSISCLYYPYEGNETYRGTVIYMHGTRKNIQFQSMYADDFARHGYNVCMMDYRGYGKSTGKRSEKAFQSDAQWMYAEVLKKYHLHEDSLIIIGRSLGSGMATMLAANNHPKKLVLISPYCWMPDIPQRYVPLFPFSWFMKWKLNNGKEISRIKCPVYIFHGTDDAIVPFSSGKKLEKMLQKPSEFISVPGAGHINITAMPLYQEKLKEILEK